MALQKIDVTAGISWVEVPEIGLRVLCGCPADAVKHLVKRGLIQPCEINGVACETGPNAVLLADVALQNGEFANLAEFPVLQMLYKQGMIVPEHPNNTGRKPILIGAPDQVDSQLRYIYRGNYGLVSREEMIKTGVSAEQAAELMRLKLKFAFGRIKPTSDFLDTRVLKDRPAEIAFGLCVRRLRLNVFEFSFNGRSVTVDLNLPPGVAYQCAYTLGLRKFEGEYFSVIHCGEGDGWDPNRSTMSSIITYQGKIYLIDAGPHLVHTLAALGIGIDQVDGIFHTHAHDDHFAGLTTLMRAGRRISYFATPLVRASVAKKFAVLLDLDEEQFCDFFEVKDLQVDVWNDVQGLEVFPAYSPHPVETNIYVFRTLWGEGYKTYAHFADIVSLSLLEGMVTGQPDQPGLDRPSFQRIRDTYLAPYDIKKIDVGGGMIHGDAMDFRNDRSPRILLAHRAGELTPEEKEIGSSAEFGTIDVLVAGNSDMIVRHAFSYLEANLPGVALHDLRLLVNHPIVEISPGTIFIREGEAPQEVLLLLTGGVEKICTKTGYYGSLSAGSMIGESVILKDHAFQHTYRASSFVRAMRFPRSLYEQIIKRNGLWDRLRRVADLRAFLNTTRLFSQSPHVAVLGRIIEGARERRFNAGEVVGDADVRFVNLIRRGQVERLVGERVLDLLQEGDFFGEEETVLNVPSLFRLRAVEDTVTVQIAGELLEDAPILRWKVMERYKQWAGRVMHDDDRFFLWNDDCAMHVAQFDSHHRRLFGIANTIAMLAGEECSSATLLAALSALVEYTRYHFTAEEELMELYRYPDMELHAREHLELTNEVLAYVENAFRDGVPHQSELIVFMESWLMPHVKGEDHKYGAFLNENGVY